MDLKPLALACGSIGGVEITPDDVRNELRTRTYNLNIGRDGLLPPMEMARLKKNVRHAVAQRQLQSVDSNQPGRFATMAQWQSSNARIMAQAHRCQSLVGQLAWQEYARGPVWLR